MSAFVETEMGDLALHEGNLILSSSVGVIAQRIKNRFNFFLGEWFLDRSLGVPYFQDILTKRPNIPVIRQIFRQVVITTPGMSDVLEFDMSYNAVTRSLDYSWVGQLTTGETIGGSSTFLVEVG